MATVPILYIPPNVGEASSSPGDFRVGSNLFVTKNANIGGNLNVTGSINGGGGGGGTLVTTTTLDNNTLPASLTSLSVSGVATVAGSNIVTAATLNGGTLPASFTSLNASGAGSIDHLTVGGTLGLTVTNTGTFNGNIVVVGAPLNNATNNSVALGGNISFPAFIQGYNGTGSKGPLQLNPSGDVVNVVGTLSINTTTLSGGNAVAIQLPTTAGTLALLPASGSYVTTVTLDNATLPASFTTLNTAGVMVMTLPGTGNTNFINAFEASQATNTAVDMSFGQSNATNLGGTLNFVFNGSSATNTVNLGLINGSQLSITGAGIFSTPHVTIDDGSGNMTTPGFLNLSSTSASGGPTLTTRAPSTKVVLAPYVSGTQVDYAIGVDNGGDGQFYRWDSVPNNGTNFRWYASTNLIMTLQGTGELNSLHNTLDDGTGLATFKGLTTNGSSTTTYTNVFQNLANTQAVNLIAEFSGGVQATGQTIERITVGSLNNFGIYIDGIFGQGTGGGFNIGSMGPGTTGNSPFPIIQFPVGGTATSTLTVTTPMTVGGNLNLSTANNSISAPFPTNSSNVGIFVGAIADLNGRRAGLMVGAPASPVVDAFNVITGGGTSGVTSFRVSGAGEVQTLNNILDNAGAASFLGSVTLSNNTLVNSTANNITLPSSAGTLALTSQIPASTNNIYAASFTTASSPVPLTQLQASSGWVTAGGSSIDIPSTGDYQVTISVTANVAATTACSVQINATAGITFGGSSTCNAYNAQASTQLLTLTFSTILRVTGTGTGFTIAISSINTGGSGNVVIRQLLP